MDDKNSSAPDIMRRTNAQDEKLLVQRLIGKIVHSLCLLNNISDDVVVYTHTYFWTLFCIPIIYTNNAFIHNPIG
jgi:hypothetical protein